jgi:pimeloyl-ACP methyl ester carboxylesterase
MRGRRQRAGRAALALVCLLAGCRQVVPRLHDAPAERSAWLAGSVTTEAPGNSPLIVLLSHSSDQGTRLVDHCVLERAGDWGFAVAPGTYSVGAFQDLDRDRTWADEPFLPGSEETRFVLADGERRDGVELVIPPEGRPRHTGGASDLRALLARTPAEQVVISLEQCMVLGDLTSLQDPRFTNDTGKMGLWRRLDFILTQRPGIWFLEPYDRERIPVLFVHGITGHPREFERIVARLDRERFQPWFCFYPSGVRLGTLGRVLAGKLAELHAEHGFERLDVVAHSMGGLVARAAILDYEQRTGRDDIRLFVTISTPFGGDARAAEGLEMPEFLPMPPSFRDMASSSAFLAGLFFEDPETRRQPRRLPPHVAHHLLFGYDNGGSGVSGDGVLTLETMLPAAVQAEARSWRAVNADHTGILRDPAALDFLVETLERAAP